ncbi:PucR family transcriptional regulator [Nonomuraea sp. NPDC050556]|uniref:PucR family transcriptional regulator n=1 Tax=Nonomuraea sp. NPDC050556 TaxID=3364369 RepID=UPI00378AA681
MAPTLRTVLRRIPLKVLAGSIEAPVRWVAVSELADPTPFLEGGELVLTTGMRLAPPYEPYVARLVGGGVAGLGFGVGLTHESVPPELVEAAAAAGLPLLEVARETPFIAIGKAVSELLAAEQYEEISRAFAAQGRLTRAALRPEGMRAVIDRLAKEVGGWAVLLDESGEVRHATPGARTDTVAAALARVGRRSPSSLAISGPDEHVVVQPLGLRGFFAVGADQPFTPVTHTVVNAAGSLLTLAVEQGRGLLEATRQVRSSVLALLLAGAADQACAVLAPLGETLPEEPLVALAAEAAALDVAERQTCAFAAPYGAGAIVLTGEDDAERIAELLPGPVGVGSPFALDDLASGLDQAQRALASARKSAAGRAHFAQLAGQGLLNLLDPAAVRAFADALLAPLVAYGSRADLLGSLRAYLAANGHWDAAAQKLGVHRHTLRYRMKRVSELLGRDLDDPGVRAELWIALSPSSRGSSRSSRS